MKKLLAGVCIVVSSVASGNEPVDVSYLGKCAAAEFHITQDKEVFDTQYKLAVANMDKHQYGAYGYGMGVIDGLVMSGMNHLIVKIYNECKAK